ncbi:MAG: ROK family protein [Lachnospiraceae bacterium]
MKIIGLDLGGTFIKCGLLNEKGEISSHWKIASPTDSLEDLLTALDKCVKDHLADADGIAISMPGKIDVRKGIAHTGGSYKWIVDLNIMEILEERYHVPVSVDNDGKCAANAEAWIGALKDVPNGLVYVLGTGIGGGIVLDHQVIHGSHMAAGELSGCVVNHKDAYSFDNLAALTGSTGSLLGQYLHKAGRKDPIDGIEFFKLIREGDAAALSVFQDFCQFTANFFYTLQTILDVDRIAIGGGISEEPMVIEGIRKATHAVMNFEGPFPLPAVEPEIVKCQFGNDANLIGAVRNFIDTKVRR